jgi:hypothetical protein
MSAKNFPSLFRFGRSVADDPENLFKGQNFNGTIIGRRDIGKPMFVECGCCCCYHPHAFHGDCRDNDNRFDPDDLDAKYGPQGWVEIFVNWD